MWGVGSWAWPAMTRPSAIWRKASSWGAGRRARQSPKANAKARARALKIILNTALFKEKPKGRNFEGITRISLFFGENHAFNFLNDAAFQIVLRIDIGAGL